jgi:hypothetical protein
MGLSISKQASSTAPKFRKKSMSKIKGGPVLWIDFTDGRTVYSDGSQTVANDSESIQVVENKAFDTRFGRGSGLSLGASLQQSVANRKPTFRTNGQNGKSYALFNGLLTRLEATTTVGNIATDVLSGSRLEGDNLTVFFVVKNLSATPGAEGVLTIQAHDGAVGGDPIIIGTQSNHTYRAFIGDQSDKSGTVLLESGTQATTNTELWTVIMTTDGASSFYTNGDPSVGTTSGASKDHTYDLRLNSTNSLIYLGQGSGGWNGHIYEVLVFDSALPDKEIKETERQLKQKYNL